MLHSAKEFATGMTKTKRIQRVVKYRPASPKLVQAAGAATSVETKADFYGLNQSENQFTVTSANKERLDAFLSGNLPTVSRSKVAQSIKEGKVLVNGAVANKPATKVRAGDHITFVPPDPPAIHVAAEPMALDILHEDAHVVVINKAPHVVVHPAPGRRTGTLVNGLLHHFGVDKLAPDVNGKLPVSFEQWLDGNPGGDDNGEVPASTSMLDNAGSNADGSEMSSGRGDHSNTDARFVVVPQSGGNAPDCTNGRDAAVRGAGADVSPCDVDRAEDLAHSTRVVTATSSSQVRSGANCKKSSLEGQEQYREYGPDEDGLVEAKYEAGVPIVRPGVVHRLDMGTTGILVVAKTNTAHARLASQFANKTARREYWSIVTGWPAQHEGTVRTNLVRSGAEHGTFATAPFGGEKGKTAVSHFKVIQRLGHGAASLVAWRLETGRTHQIRVHARHIGHPLLGDVAYGGTAKSLASSLASSFQSKRSRTQGKQTEPDGRDQGRNAYAAGKRKQEVDDSSRIQWSQRTLRGNERSVTLDDSARKMKLGLHSGLCTNGEQLDVATRRKAASVDLSHGGLGGSLLSSGSDRAPANGNTESIPILATTPVPRKGTEIYKVPKHPKQSQSDVLSSHVATIHQDQQVLLNQLQCGAAYSENRPRLVRPNLGVDAMSGPQYLEVKAAVLAAVETLGRPALHACVLGFLHPNSSEAVDFWAEMPADMKRVVDAFGGD